MGKTTGFLEYGRSTGPVRPEEERRKDFLEFHGMLPLEEQRKQAARCMDCGIPFCQAGTLISGMVSGCPLHNLIPEINDLVYHGRMAEAYRRLTVTSSFPEFTSRVCPALCEAACTCGLHDEPVTTKENERAVIEYAFAHDLVKEEKPSVRTGKKVAVVGSGPAGLAAAQLLNRRGHEVTVYERSDRIGGLLRYGIPNMKLDKSLIDRRIRLMEEAGIRFLVKSDVGKTVSAEELMKEYDGVLLCCGASEPRDIKVPGREAKGIRFAVEFLSSVTKAVLDGELAADSGSPLSFPGVTGKDVIVIGGGDTGNDCVGSCIRLGAKSVTQLEMMPKPPESRTPKNPWPEWPKIRKTDYGQEEAIHCFGSDPRIYQTTVKEFAADKRGNLKEAVLLSLKSQKDEKTGRMQMVPIEGSERTVKAQLVLIAAGFLGSEAYVAEAFAAERDGRTNIRTEAGGHLSSRPKLFCAGDMRSGQSLVVRAIADGRAAAKEVDFDLMGYTNL